jgi:hypothetical protein
MILPGKPENRFSGIMRRSTHPHAVCRLVEGDDGGQI